MGGPNLEVFKFGLYLFVPVLALLHFGDPQWYHDNVLPVRFRLAPSPTYNSLCGSTRSVSFLASMNPTVYV